MTCAPADSSDPPTSFSSGFQGHERRSSSRPTQLWEKVRDKVRHLHARMRDETERRRINEALGRPVQRDVFDAERRRILACGEPVTRIAITQARSSGALETLLTAVRNE